MSDFPFVSITLLIDAINKMLILGLGFRFWRFRIE